VCTPYVNLRFRKPGTVNRECLQVDSMEAMATVLEQGSLMRATAATGMNKKSSRSHAIFTITLEQRRPVGCLEAKQGPAEPLWGELSATTMALTVTTCHEAA